MTTRIVACYKDRFVTVEEAVATVPKYEYMTILQTVPQLTDEVPAFPEDIVDLWTQYMQTAGEDEAEYVDAVWHVHCACVNYVMDALIMDNEPLISIHNGRVDLLRATVIDNGPLIRNPARVWMLTRTLACAILAQDVANMPLASDSAQLPEDPRDVTETSSEEEGEEDEGLFTLQDIIDLSPSGASGVVTAVQNVIASCRVPVPPLPDAILDMTDDREAALHALCFLTATSTLTNDGVCSVYGCLPVHNKSLLVHVTQVSMVATYDVVLRFDTGYTNDDREQEDDDDQSVATR